MNPIELRPYQDTAVTLVQKAFADGHRRVATVLPTGAGKTVILSELIRRHRETDLRPVLVLAHRTELLTQAREKILHANPTLDVGLVQGQRNRVSADVIVASVQTLYNQKRRDKLPELGLVVVDECHRSPSRGYMNVLTGLRTTEDDGPLVAGYTATFTREDSSRLTDFWQTVPFSMDLIDLIDMGFLVPPRFRRVLVEGLDLAAVKTSQIDGGKDLASGDLAAAMERAGAPGVVAAAYREHAPERQGIVFTPTVASAEHVAEALRDVGITSEALSGTTPTAQRRDILGRYKAGTLQTVVNCAILGEGFDAPETSCVVIARPTCSKILFRQQVGRALRPAGPGKTDALILDLVGSTGRNDLTTMNDITDAPIHIEEGERLDEAVERTAKAKAAVEGDALVSGSLLGIDYDPWDAERRAKRTRAEIKAEDGPEEPAEPPKARARYQHIENRNGWFLKALSGSWFIPLRTESKQRGVIVLNGTTVGLAMDGVQNTVVGTYAHPGQAIEKALELTMILLEGAVSRSSVDPDARWRRRPTSEQQAEYLARLSDIETPRYSGQTGDLISILTQSKAVENLTRWLDQQ